MTIDMHAHWFPDALADAFRKRTVKPRVYAKDGMEYLESTFAPAPLRLEPLDRRIAEMDRTGVELGVLSLSPVTRSEEHTSELQSLRHLVCRLLLETKKHRQRSQSPDEQRCRKRD